MGKASTAEQKFKEVVGIKYVLYRSGWPDFIVRLGNRIEFVEVKKKGSNLSKNQKLIKTIFQELGLVYKVWTPEDEYRFTGKGFRFPKPLKPVRIKDFSVARCKDCHLLHPNKSIKVTFTERCTGCICRR